MPYIYVILALQFKGMLIYSKCHEISCFLNFTNGKLLNLSNRKAIFLLFKVTIWLYYVI